MSTWRTSQAELGASTQVEGTLHAANGVALSNGDVLSGDGTVDAPLTTTFDVVSLNPVIDNSGGAPVTIEHSVLWGNGFLDDSDMIGVDSRWLMYA